ncbi:hypothetical protein D9M71_198660 [compost metagenome]
MARHLLRKLRCIELLGPLVQAIQYKHSKPWAGAVEDTARAKAQCQVEHWTVMGFNEADFRAPGGSPRFRGGRQGWNLTKLDIVCRLQVGHGREGGVGGGAIAQQGPGGKGVVVVHAGAPGRR